MRLLIGMIAAALVTGCASTGYQQASKTAQDLQTSRADVDVAGQQIAATMALLNDLAAAPPQADLRPLYTQLRRDVKSIEKEADRAATRAEQYRRSADAYAQSWADEVATIENPEIRKVSGERRAELIGNLRAIENQASATRVAYGPLLVDLQGIVQYLGLDLTAGGVAAVKPQIDKARQDAQALQAQAGKLMSELDRVSGSLAPSTGVQ